jgi:hypothetical protein
MYIFSMILDLSICLWSCLYFSWYWTCLSIFDHVYIFADIGLVYLFSIMFIMYKTFLFLKNMCAAIIDFRVCPPLVKCKNLMFSGFIDTLIYAFSSTGVSIYCYFGLKFNDNTISYKILIWLPLFSYAWKATKKNKKGKKVHAVFYQVGFILILYGEYNYNIRFLKLLLYDLTWSNNDKKCA